MNGRYDVSVGGRSLPVQECRVSAYPMNRVWPGHQRPEEQTETAWFVSFDMDGPVELVIRLTDGTSVRTAEIRPQSLGLVCRTEADRIVLRLERPALFTVEINGRHGALSVFADPPFEIGGTQGEVLRFGAGEHDVGIMTLHDRQTVILDEGAVVYGGFLVDHAADVRICGRGILDGSRIARQTAMYNDQTENLFTAVAAERLTVEGIILRDAPLWAFTLRNGCRHVSIRNVKLIGMWRYNTDGFDICNSSDVEIAGCFVRSFDDCVVVRAPYLTGESGGCERVTVRDSVLWCDWGKNLEVWSGHLDSVICDVEFRNIDCIHVCHTAVSIDTWYGSASILTERISYRDVRIEPDDPPMSPVLQTEDGQVYEPDPRFRPSAVCIRVGRLGRKLDNQGCDTAADVSDFSIVYRDVTLENVAVLGNDGAFDSTIDARKLRAADGFVLRGCRLGNLRTYPPELAVFG